MSYFIFVDKVIVAQWAKLKYGVFDEDYSDEDGNGGNPGIRPFYPQPNPNSVEDIEGTRCSRDVHGSIIDLETGQPCRKSPNGEYPDTCRFRHDLTGQDARTSLMYASNVESVS